MSCKNPAKKKTSQVTGPNKEHVAAKPRVTGISKAQSHLAIAGPHSVSDLIVLYGHEKGYPNWPLSFPTPGSPALSLSEFSCLSLMPATVTLFAESCFVSHVCLTKVQ